MTQRRKGQPRRFNGKVSAKRPLKIQGLSVAEYMLKKAAQAQSNDGEKD